jgi:hypothetical protein
MRKLNALVPLAALALAATTARPASANRGDCGPLCKLIAVPIAVGVVGGIAVGYAYGTGYYIVNDLKDEPHHASYYGTELFLHGSLATLFVGATRDELRAGRTGSAIGTGAFAALHVTLALHGVGGVWSERDEIQTPSGTLVHWGLGSAYGINTLAWASSWPGTHSRGYGIAEVVVNAPITVGLGLIARDRMHDDRGAGAAVLYSGMAAISAIYVAHGIKTLVVPRRRNKLDLLGTDVMPTVVSDGLELAPGLGAAGSF